MSVSRLLRIAQLRVRSMLRKDAVDGEAAREIAFHFERLVDENLSDGMPLAQARRAARVALGNPAALEDQCRDHRRVAWFHDCRQDVVYGLRVLRRNPGFTAVAALSLALGIGANAATLGAIDAVFVQGPPFEDSDRLVVLQTVPDSNPSQRSNASMADLVAWQEQAAAFESIAASLPIQADLGADAPGTYAERIQGYAFTGGMFPLLGVPPLLGRVFTDADPPLGMSGSAIVVSHGFWQRRFGGDAAVLGRRIRLNGVDVSVIGVMPEGFFFPDNRPDFWAPLRADRAPAAGPRFYLTVGKLKSGVTLQQAQSDLEAVNVRLIHDAPGRHRGFSVRVEDLRAARYGWAKRPLLTLQAASLMVLLLACVNVAALSLARGTVRLPELGLRMSLGAGRGRIARQILTESLLLALVAGGLGLLVTALCLSGVVWLKAIPGLPDLPPLAINWRILVLNVGLSMVAGIGFGMAPAIAGSTRLLASMRSQDRTTTGPAPHRVRSALVATQLALALMLLAGAGLLLNSFVRLATRDLNFDPRGLMSFEIDIPIREYSRTSGVYHGLRYFEIVQPPSHRISHIFERVRELPGVVSIGGVSHRMVNRLIVPRVDVATEGPLSARGSDGAALRAAYFMVTPDLFATIRTPVVRGRAISDDDRFASPWVAVVNETMARRLWTGEDPIGKRVTLDIVPDEQPREIVGVVRDIPVRRGEPAEPAIYTSYLQQPLRYGGQFANMLGQMTFYVRATADPMNLVPEIRRTVATLERDRPVANIRRADIETYLLVRDAFPHLPDRDLRVPGDDPGLGRRLRSDVLRGGAADQGDWDSRCARGGDPGGRRARRAPGTHARGHRSRGRPHWRLGALTPDRVAAVGSDADRPADFRRRVGRARPGVASCLRPSGPPRAAD